MIGSSLATLHMWSPNHYNGRIHPITKITVHHVAGKLKAATIGNIFLKPTRKASSTYGIGYDAEIGQYVDEADAPWTSSNYDNDQRAITIEVSNSAVGGDWPVSDECLEALIRLLVDCVQRNPGIREIDFTGDKTGNLTMHKWFAATACPGPYLESKFPYIASEINKRLGVSPEASSPPPAPEEPRPTPTVLYRVQTGAFSKKENALALKAKLEKDGFLTYLVKTKKFYKVQVGAYSKKANAEAQATKLKKAGYNTYITTESGTPVNDVARDTLAVSDKVRMSKGAPVWGQSYGFQSWVYSSTLYVRDIDGNCVTISTRKTGAITGQVHKQYLTEV